MSTVLMGHCCQCEQPAVLVPATRVCDACAESIANRWNFSHSGRWLTWPNEPSPKRTKAVIPAALRTEVFERDLYRCRRCSTHLNLTADHVIPEIKGGPTTLENLQTLCRSCNSSKGRAMEQPK
ncbi:MAG TPA: HNH endonuclease [Burkholderiaceae bacterium]|nr:HNH endonuclease [Burkholderiaceae bacterium]